MHTAIVPETFSGLLTAFAGCFTTPSYRNVVTLMTGWVQCLGRRTITGLVVAAGAVDSRHISVFHRFVSRAQWALDDLGQVVFRLALAWLPAGGPLIVVIDDTLCRKSGKGICLASMHHDPLLSSGRKPCFSPGTPGSSSSGTFGWCWRAGYRCRRVAPTALPCLPCFDSTGVRTEAGRPMHRPGGRAAHACARRRRFTWPVRVPRRWSWPVS